MTTAHAQRASSRPSPTERYGADQAAAAASVSTRRAARDPALDGLRGLAALVVVFHHSLLGSPAVIRAYTFDDHHVGAPWVLVRTPLHLFWSGTEAVYVFFVLSGFVLTRPMLGRMSKQRLAAYYPQRLARLYLPIWAAVLVSIGIVLAVPRHLNDAATWWINDHALPVNLHNVVQDLVVVAKTNYLNSALWSLGYEILFSLILPVYVLTVQWTRRWPTAPKVLLAAALSGLGVAAMAPHNLVVSCLIYMPMFLVGALMAGDRDRLVAGLARRSRAQLWSLAVVALLGLDVRWYLGPVDSRVVAGLATTFEVMSAGTLVLLFLAWEPARRAGSNRVSLWLGQRSFSLYLIHEPIVVSVAVLLGPEAAAYTAFIAVPIALVAAEVFFRVFERPSHRLSQRLRSAVERRVDTTDRPPPKHRLVTDAA